MDFIRTGKLVAALGLVTLIQFSAQAEIEGFDLGEGDAVTLKCQSPPVSMAKTIRVNQAFSVCRYENVECRVESPKRGIFFNGEVSIRCPANPKGCPLFNDCGKKRFGKDELAQLETLEAAEDPNMANRGNQIGVFGADSKGRPVRK